ncbi:ATP-binding cassette domain-containing protein [Diaphorobacter sp.]|uniref:ABC transporter ATP-binding protein n=1 Tax=Diaphorobacter sp. TaxID=1934310 RepID=UPI002590F25D|nr:ATP-binding cassette domain-containing protein [Diaphorobacter sp.]HRO80563.1 ATP-binding cassette domain-containing protein [Alicycliphilus denitrificans]
MTTPPATPPPLLQVRGLHHAYGPTAVLQDIDLDLPAGRIAALVGPSGCGKTTLLHLCAGLLAPQQGRIERPGAPVAVMFQQPRLLPWMATLDNIALGLKAQGVPRAQRRERARAAALALGLPEASLAQYPAELSGGMQSRAALARALVLEPALLLMDEPFSALDVGLRGQLHQLLLARQAQSGMAVLLITHDLMEAVRLADEVLVLAAAPGRIIARYRPPGEARARGEALVHRCAAQLLQHPEVRAAFGLPEQDAPDAAGAPPAEEGGGAWLQAPRCAAPRASHGC